MLTRAPPLSIPAKHMKTGLPTKTEIFNKRRAQHMKGMHSEESDSDSEALEDDLKVFYDKFVARRVKNDKLATRLEQSEKKAAEQTEMIAKLNASLTDKEAELEKIIADKAAIEKKVEELATRAEQCDKKAAESMNKIKEEHTTTTDALKRQLRESKKETAKQTHRANTLECQLDKLVASAKSTAEVAAKVSSDPSPAMDGLTGQSGPSLTPGGLSSSMTRMMDGLLPLDSYRYGMNLAHKFAHGLGTPAMEKYYAPYPAVTGSANPTLSSYGDHAAGGENPESPSTGAPTS